ncbi:MAG TPA: hypothetical protein VF037_01395 [Gemmatimonadales bacterium]
MLRMLIRAVPAALLALALQAGASAAQVAPTLPSDTLQGRKLPPEANVPRQVIAPTLPSDTLRGAGPCPAELAVRPVPSTPRPPAAPRDTAAAPDTAGAVTIRTGCPPAAADTTGTKGDPDDES